MTIVGGLALCNAGCTTIPGIQVQCLPQRTYTRAWQTAFAAELRALEMRGDVPHVAEAIVDYERLRDADRACLAAR